MKKVLYVLAMTMLIFSCSNDIETLDTSNPATENNVDLKSLIPNPTFDVLPNGRYAGVIVSNAADFHGKVWINIGDSSLRQFAQVELIETQQRVDFDLTEELGANVYRFSNAIGSFDADFSVIDDVVISNVTIQGNDGQVRLAKETSNGRMLIHLGTYADNLLPAPGTGGNGTWDVMIDGDGFITELIVVTAGNNMIIDEAANFEVGETGCYGPLLPQLFDSGDGAFYELYATGQLWEPFGAGGGLIAYDFNFSKNIADANGLPYTGGVGFPAATNGIIYGDADGNPLPVGCYSLDVQGVFLWQNAAGDAFVAAGSIAFDTSTLPPPPPSSSLQGSSLPSITAHPPVQ